MADKWLKEQRLSAQFTGYGAIILLVGTLFVWGNYAKLSGAVISTGALEVASHRQIIQHQLGGKVKEILVREGSDVKAGDVILRLDDRPLRAEFEISNQLYIEALAEKGRLVAERDAKGAPEFPDALLELAGESASAREAIDAQQKLFEYRRSALGRELALLDDQARQIDEQIVGYRREVEAQRKQKTYADSEYASQKRLRDQGLATEAALTTLRMELAKIDGAIGVGEAQIATLRESKTSLATERLKLAAMPREEAIIRLREIESDEVEFYQKRARFAANLEELELRAPIGGTVYALAVHSPEVVIEPAQPLLQIVPEGSELLVRAELRAEDINDVYVGQEGELRFSAMNQRQMPQIYGKLANISADAFTHEQTGQRYYEIEIAPEPTLVDKIGEDALIPGQAVEIFLSTGERSFFEYLMKPLTDNFARAFREE